MTPEPRRTRTEHPPVRIAHLGLGAFHRAHQAWYTQKANDAHSAEEAWGIAAFTGRSAGAAQALSGADGVYTVLERSAEADEVDTVQSIVKSLPGTHQQDWLRTIADPAVAALTLTVTEAGYAPSATPPRRIVEALAARAAAHAGPITLVSCDNLLGNGQVLHAAVHRAAKDAGIDAAVIEESASFVNTVVDRITPAVTAEDLALVRRLTGYDDPAAVVTEPFSEWVLAGAFPAGRPEWEAGGARFVDDVTPYEERKLWLLNAAHSFLAAAGRLNGYETVAEAYDDPGLHAGTDALWAEQRACIDLPASEIDPWLDQLRVRFANPRIAHRLDQIRRDSPMKIAQRLVAPVRRAAARGIAVGDAQSAALATWAQSLVELEPTDAVTAALARELAAIEQPHRVQALIERLTPEGALK